MHILSESPFQNYSDKTVDISHRLAYMHERRQSDLCGISIVAI